MGKPPYSIVGVRLDFWNGRPVGQRKRPLPPRAGDVFQTSTGRRYLIREAKGRNFVCMVLGKHDDYSAPRVWALQWSYRKRSKQGKP